MCGRGASRRFGPFSNINFHLFAHSFANIAIGICTKHFREGAGRIIERISENFQRNIHLAQNRPEPRTDLVLRKYCFKIIKFIISNRLHFFYVNTEHSRGRSRAKFSRWMFRLFTFFPSDGPAVWSYFPNWLGSKKCDWNMANTFGMANAFPLNSTIKFVGNSSMAIHRRPSIGRQNGNADN